ncbi:MAG: hypothetical protein K0Q67_3233, partial [Cellvibrio sp.]|nr:hypothetical protein [Cellvibrio sp.]
SEDKDLIESITCFTFADMANLLYNQCGKTIMVLKKLIQP